VTGTVVVPVAVGLLVAALVGLALVPFAVLHPQPGPPTGRGSVARWALVSGYVAAVAAATLVPLPEPGTQQCLDGGARAQLLPFHSVARLGGSDPAVTDVLAQVVLNVALFVPLGVLLTRWWGLSLGRAAAVGALVSLGIETTQLTGVWFLYDCAHRVFDVDDVIANAAGTALGAALTAARRRTSPG
jgi:glycopeptide antibiotics resistance protein